MADGYNGDKLQNGTSTRNLTDRNGDGDKARNVIEDRIKIVRERQEQKRDRRLSDLLAVQERETKIRQIKEAEREKQAKDLRTRHMNRHQAVEERRKLLQVQEYEKRRQIMAKYKEYEDKLVNANPMKRCQAEAEARAREHKEIVERERKENEEKRLQAEAEARIREQEIVKEKERKLRQEEAEAMAHEQEENAEKERKEFEEKRRQEEIEAKVREQASESVVVTSNSGNVELLDSKSSTTPMSIDTESNHVCNQIMSVFIEAAPSMVSEKTQYDIDAASAASFSKFAEVMYNNGSVSTTKTLPTTTALNNAATAINVNANSVNRNINSSNGNEDDIDNHQHGLHNHQRNR